MSTTPQNPAGTPVPAPQAAAAAPVDPGPVSYVAGTAMAQVTVDGRKMDVPVADLVRKYQIGSAAEQRLAEANRMADANRADIDFSRHLRQLAASNPEAAMEEARRRLGLPSQPKASDNAQGDSDLDPQTQRLSAELQQLRAKIAGIDQFRDEMVTKSVQEQIGSAVREMPLYKADPAAAGRAERFVAAYLQANPAASIREVTGLVHADDVDFVQRQLQQTRDSRAATTQQLAGLPANAGTPGLTQIPQARMTDAEFKAPSSRGAFSRMIAEARKMAGG